MNRLSLLLFALVAGISAGAGETLPIVCTPKANDVIVLLGDSFTDGYTYPQIVMQALKEAGKPCPAFVCAGMGGAPTTESYVNNHLKMFKPTILTLLWGGRASVAEFEKSVRDITSIAKPKAIPMILITPGVFDWTKRKETPEKAKEIEQCQAACSRTMRTIAREEGYAFADCYTLMRAAADAGKDIMSADGIHPNYMGQSLIARALLDAMGYTDVPLPKEFKPQMLPGVIGAWKMRLAPTDESSKQPIKLNEKTISELRPDLTWKNYTLPDPAPAEIPASIEWEEQERRNGFGRRIEEVVGKGSVQAIAEIDSREARTAFISTGAYVTSAWLNGTKIYEQTGWAGYHAGKERIPVQLQKGTNTLTIEISGREFFISVTDDLIWEASLR